MENLREFISSHGYSFEPDCLEGIFSEFQESDGKKGWYVGSEETSTEGKPFITFTFGDWRTGERYTFIEDIGLSEEDQKKAQKKLKSQERLRKKETLKKQSRVSGEATKEWDRFLREGTTKYLQRKKIGLPLGARFENDDLLVPMKDLEGKLWGYQRIKADGFKGFLEGQRVQGLMHLLGKITGTTKVLYICEGFATGASLYLATENPVIVAFQANNLKTVALLLRKQYPKLPITICGDDDKHKPVNAGRDKAREAASLAKAHCVFPKFIDETKKPTDFNDLHCLEGLSKVEEQVGSAVIVSPDNVIPTEHTGFHEEEVRGKSVIYTPRHDHLVQYYERETHFKILGESKICYVWTGTHYEEVAPQFIKSFADRHYYPPANKHKVSEFEEGVYRNHKNLRHVEWWSATTYKRINFQNGILDLQSGSFLSHSPEFGFRYCLPFKYNEKAKAPLFEQFLDDVTKKENSYKKILLQYIGYVLSGDDCWTQKALILEGEGRNGKSTFLNIIRELIGKGNYTNLTLKDLQKDTSRQMLDGKLLNIGEETPRVYGDATHFKNLTAGGEVSARQLYKNPYEFRNKCKFIFSCNELPQSEDTTFAYFRRFIIIKFDETFSEDKGNLDPFIEQKLLKELPGILNLALEGYKELVKDRAFYESDASKRAINSYRRSLDHTSKWLEEQLEFKPIGNGADEKFVSIPDTYKEYKISLEQAGIKPENAVVFGKKLSRLAPEYDLRLKYRKKEGKSHRSLIATNYLGSEFGY